MKRTLILILILAGLAGGGYGLARGAGWIGESGEIEVEGVAVRRGPLRIGVLESGNLEVADSVDLKSEIEGSTTILSLIPEGTYVQPGDLLVELDTTELKQDRLTQEISVQNAEAQQVKAAQVLEIQKSQNESDIAAAERQLEFARKDQIKYIEGDWPQQQQQASDEILLAQEELARAEDNYEWSQKLAEDGFLTQTELEADRLAHQRTQVQVAQAERAKELLVDYDHPRQLEALEADVEEAERELDRVKLQAKARLVDYEADLQASLSRLELEREKLEKYNSQLAKAKIVAPIEGMVVYAREKSRWGNGEPISEGKQVRERESLVTIPSARAMVVEAAIHESVLEQVQVGQRVVVSVDAIPGRTFPGRVQSRAVLPDQNSWWANPDLRVYRTEIEVLETDPAMRPGMSCSVDVIVAELEDALHVPLQTIFLDGGKPVVFVAEGGGNYDVRGVEVGHHNDVWVEILDGLREGEMVAMAQPEGYSLDTAIEEQAPEGAAGAGEGQMGGQPGGGQAGGGQPGGGKVGGGKPGGGKPKGGKPGGAAPSAAAASLGDSADASSSSSWAKDAKARTPRGDAVAGAPAAGSEAGGGAPSANALTEGAADPVDELDLVAGEGDAAGGQQPAPESNSTPTEDGDASDPVGSQR